MLNEATQKAIAKLLRMDEAAFTTALKDEKEVEVKLPELTAFSADELRARDENTKRTGYNEGKTAGEELLIKGQREKLGLTFEGKDPDAFITALKEKILSDAKVEPNKQLQEKEVMITNLQKNIQTLQGQVSTLEGEKTAISNRSKLLAYFPENTKTSISPSDILTLAEANGFSFKEENGILVPSLNGQVVRDATTQNPIPAQQWLPNFLKEKNYIVAEEPNRGGRGAGSDKMTTGTATKMSEATKAWEAEGKSANSAEFQAHVLKLAKDNPNFDMDN
ncbi:hypothetical protein [Chitinophaga sp. YIM B06452]|uniref:hypothetical protein n=1 Tax=Chitinophaga sp. YIM B06452 TaxID=3082158 RepID=UPI0031FEF768